MTKTFSTAAVLGVYTGRILNSDGFAPIHEVMDFFFPGIMTLGCAHMLDVASAEVARQYPDVVDLGPCTETNYQEYYGDALVKYGTTMALSNDYLNISRSPQDEIDLIRSVRPDADILGVQL
jgi:hypothetical protein